MLARERVLLLLLPGVGRGAGDPAPVAEPAGHGAACVAEGGAARAGGLLLGDPVLGIVCRPHAVVHQHVVGGPLLLLLLLLALVGGPGRGNAVLGVVGGPHAVVHELLVVAGVGVVGHVGRVGGVVVRWRDVALGHHDRAEHVGMLVLEQRLALGFGPAAPVPLPEEECGCEDESGQDCITSQCKPWENLNPQTGRGERANHDSRLTQKLDQQAGRPPRSQRFRRLCFRSRHDVWYRRGRGERILANDMCWLRPPPRG